MLWRDYYSRPHTVLFPAVKVTEAPEDDGRLGERFKLILSGSESLMPERPYHFHVS